MADFAFRDRALVGIFPEHKQMTSYGDPLALTLSQSAVVHRLIASGTAPSYGAADAKREVPSIASD
ncbi:hypothetical protein N7533_012109 [Penicillium manginii]|uniref:uncharacterized protein n=1 Tax=Penicillium manginii TaxID=203109 RepID=UPI0025475E3A|nr:uncharacterized protein N7533_012109 [Penicillium manginii]KAJ5739325.1 hypothetical protein N7533_012109 [Penicillium manginii]